MNAEKKSMESWLNLVRLKFLELNPSLIPIFNIYASEALFGRSFIDANIFALDPKKSKILEIGAGSLLLSCQLVREGFDVTALEPFGDGFSHFEQMREIILSVANDHICCPSIINQSAETLDIKNTFEFAFSINVMEHVEIVESVIEKVCRSLIEGGVYRFTCPNYIFPYEPHFNIPTLLSKRLTSKFFGWKIYNNPNMPDPIGVWRSLNWINIFQLKYRLKLDREYKITFNKSMASSTLKRIATDHNFAARRSPIIRNLILVLVNLRVHLLFNLIPAIIQPVIDCSIKKIATTESL